MFVCILHTMATVCDVILNASLPKNIIDRKKNMMLSIFKSHLNHNQIQKLDVVFNIC